VAREIGRARVGCILRVLVERRATARERQQAQAACRAEGDPSLLAPAPAGLRRGDARGGDARPGGLGGVWTVARSEADAPEVDGRVYVRGPLPCGAFARVQVVSHTDYDLVADPG
jgi:ribosomal protein S12 methylthiotransferase